MAELDLEHLLVPISEDAPCGDDLEYDLQFGEMERAAVGKPEQQFGDTIVPAEDPDWRDLQRACVKLLDRTKDIRVVVYLTRAVLNVDGFLGFRDCLTLLRRYVEQYWDTVHPQLDPDDDNDPTLRVNTLAQLCDGETTLALVRKTPLVRSRAVGVFSLFDIEVATGEIKVAGEAERPEMSTIEAAFLDCDVDQLQATATAVREAIDNVNTLETSLTEKVGVANATSFEPLVRVLKQADRALESQLDRRGVSGTSGAAGATDGESGGEGGASAVTAGSQRLTGEIASREDVLRALDKICEYYDRYEPSSPLPLLLKRAKRLATKSFLEIIRDLTPDAFSQAESLGGSTDESGE
jgi:type VI secretion system protein ImpA